METPQGKTSDTGCRQGGSPQSSAKDSQPVLSTKPEQALLGKSGIFCSNWLKVKGTRANWLQEVNTPNKSAGLMTNASFRTARGSEISLTERGKGKLNQLL